MRTRIALLALATALCLAGCVAVRGRSPLALEPVAARADRPRALVIGVRAPRVRLDPPSIPGLNGEPRTALVELERALSLIRSLRASGLYREVDFEKQLQCVPDVVLELKRPPATCELRALPILLGIPLWYTCDTGHYFARIDDAEARFAFPWQESVAIGGTAPLLIALPDWTPSRAPARLDDTFRAFLLAHESELAAGARTDAEPTCAH